MRRADRPPVDGPQTLFERSDGATGHGGYGSARDALARGRDVPIDTATIERTVRKNARVFWVAAGWWYALTFALLFAQGRVFPKALGGPLWLAVSVCVVIWAVDARRSNRRLIEEATVLRDPPEAVRGHAFDAAPDVDDSEWDDVFEREYEPNAPAEVARFATERLFLVFAAGYATFTLVCLFFTALGMKTDGTLPGPVYLLALLLAAAAVRACWPRRLPPEEEAPPWSGG